MTARATLMRNTRVRRRRDGRIGTVCEPWPEAPSCADGADVVIVCWDFGGGLPCGEAVAGLEVLGRIVPEPDPVGGCGLGLGREQCIFLQPGPECHRFTARRWEIVVGRGFTTAQRMPDAPWPACMCAGPGPTEAA
jgi:hypothetical protein